MHFTTPVETLQVILPFCGWISTQPSLEKNFKYYIFSDFKISLYTGFTSEITSEKKLESVFEKHKTHLSVLLTNKQGLRKHWSSHTKAIKQKPFLQMTNTVHNKPLT